MRTVLLTKTVTTVLLSDLVRTVLLITVQALAALVAMMGGTVRLKVFVVTWPGDTTRLLVPNYKYRQASRW